MKKWHCVITVEGAEGREDHEITAIADSRDEAEEIAFNHYTELADEAVMLSPESPAPLILHEIKISGYTSQGAGAVVCSTCGNPNLQRSGVCHVCPTCGTTTGCS